MPQSEPHLQRIAELYWGYSVGAVDTWIGTGFPFARDSFPHAGPPLDKDFATGEALAAAIAAGHFALEGLGDPPLALRLEAAATEFAVKQGNPRVLIDFYRHALSSGVDDEQRCMLLGLALLARFRHPDTDSLRPTIPLAVGTFLFSEAIMSWRRAQDHND